MRGRAGKETVEGRGATPSEGVGPGAKRPGPELHYMSIAIGSSR